MAIKCSDISNPCRCWPVSLGWASLVCEEFFLQGDVEKTQGLSVMSTHDRCMSTKADIQLGFIRFIVRPLVAQWNCFLKSDLSITLVNHVELNLNNWESFKQRFVSISTKTLPNSSVKIEINCPPLSGLATLTEESTLASSCITRRNSNNQRRFSLPDNVTVPATRTVLKSQQNVSTTITTFPRLSVSVFNRRSSLPQHPKSATSVLPEIYNRSRRGSLPLNSRAFPVPSAWDEAIGTSNLSAVTIVKPNEHLQTRRGSAPLISYPRCGQDYAGPTIAKGCSREQLLLEVYWMTASSSVSSINSVHGASNSNIPLLSSVHPQSSSSSSGHNDSNSEFVTIR